MAPPGGKQGFAALHVARVHGASSVLLSRSRSPLCLLTPRPRGRGVWAYTSNLGGGMVAGDVTSIDLRIDPGALCFLGTQASSKIYRNPLSQPCEHRLTANIHESATLIFAPDAVQCFADAAYQQHQTFHLALDANLILVDWLSAGRLARGERWDFKRYSSRNEIFVNDKPLVIDSVELDHQAGLPSKKFQTGRFNCFGLLLLTGPTLAKRSSEILKDISDLPIKPGASLLLTASPVENGVLVRFAGASIEQIGQAIREHLSFVKDMLHDDPWSRKW
jgi:urease accessory protein